MPPIVVCDNVSKEFRTPKRQPGVLAVSINFETDRDLPLIAPEAGWDLQCITEEAIGNAVRHGRATEVTVSLAKEPAGVVLEIVDNGGTADPIDIESLPVSSTGLRGIRARAERLEATAFPPGPAPPSVRQPSVPAGAGAASRRSAAPARRPPRRGTAPRPAGPNPDARPADQGGDPDRAWQRADRGRDVRCGDPIAAAAGGFCPLSSASASRNTRLSRSAGSTTPTPAAPP